MDALYNHIVTVREVIALECLYCESFIGYANDNPIFIGFSCPSWKVTPFAPECFN